MAQRPNNPPQRTGHANDVAADFFAAGLTQAQLAKAVKAPLRTVQNWEQRRREPDLSTLKTLAKLQGASLDELVIEPAPKRKK
jgi:transcriptional regulator with XRE-family HTH domain